MARQTGPFKITGTLDDLCFYQMEGRHFVRRKSSLTSKRFWKDSAFAGSRRSCDLLARASRLASRLYCKLPQTKKGRAVYQGLTGHVKRLLKAGQGEAAVVAWFERVYAPVAPRKQARKAIRRPLLPTQSLVVQQPVERAGRRRGISKRPRAYQPLSCLGRGQPRPDTG